MTIGTRLRAARRYLRLSQTAVAQELGTRRQAVAAFEKDERLPDVKQFAHLANLFRITLDQLLTGNPSTGAPHPTPVHLARGSRGKLDPEDEQELFRFWEFLLSRETQFGERIERGVGETRESLIERLRTEMGIRELCPVPVLKILRRMGVEVRFTGLSKLSGALLTPGGGHPVGVLVNSDQPFERQRFSAAHELAHLVLGHKHNQQTSVSKLGRRFEPDEVDADQFAAELLLPPDLLGSTFAGRLPAPIEQVAFMLSQDFTVSYLAMINRLSNLGLISRQDADALKKKKPSEIARGLPPRALATSPFEETLISEVASRLMPDDRTKAGTPDAVRTLQEHVYTEYLQSSPEDGSAEPAGVVYPAVARWVAKHYPIVAQC